MGALYAYPNEHLLRNMCGEVDHVQLMQNLDMHIIQFRKQ